MNCKNGKCDVAARIAAARAGRAGVGSQLPMEQYSSATVSLPPASGPGGMGIGLLALAALVVIVMGRK